ncbi:MAG: beta-lactamase, partial [Gemmatimonadetes bacterium]|nr:beta-lactamase [Gemmatimonadota bacterium]
GAAAGREAAGLGVHAALVTAPPIAPDAGLSPVDARSPAAYAGTLGYLDGLRSSGLLVVARAFPAPNAPADSGFAALEMDRAAAEAGPLGFVRRFAAAGADGIALGAVAVPALTGDSLPLAVSPVAIRGDLRRDLAFAGIVLADVGAGSALERAYGEREAAIRAVAAGADMVAGPRDPRGVIDGLVGAVRSGRITRARLDEAVRRIFAAKQRAGIKQRGGRKQGGDDGSPKPADAAATRKAAHDAFDASTLAYGSAPAQVLRGCRRTALVTAPGVDAEALAGALSRVPGGLVRMQADSVWARGSLLRAGSAGSIASTAPRPSAAASPSTRSPASSATARPAAAAVPPASPTPAAPAEPDCLVIARFPAAEPAVSEWHGGPPKPPAPPKAETATRPSASRTTGARSTGRKAGARSSASSRAPTPPKPKPSPAAAADSARAVADTTRRRIVDVAFATGGLPPYGAGAQVLAWGTGPEAQAAAARALLGQDAGDARRPASSAWPPAPVLRRADAAAAGMDATKLARVDEIVMQGVQSGVFPGASIAVIRHGMLVKLRGYGALHGEAGAPAVSAESTLYDLASLTKVAGTTAAAMALVDEGRLDLDAPVHRYLSGFRGGDRGDVTIRNLLTHTAGLPPGEDLYSDQSSPEGAMREVLKEPLVYTPGTKMVYSDFSMILLKAVVEKQAGEPIDRYLARRVWGPLGMANTMYLPPVRDRRRTAPGAIRTERPYVVRGVVHDANAFRLGGVAGHAGLFSTARDLAVYTQTLLAGGAYGPRRIWSRAVVARFTADQGLPGHRALGWDRPADKSSAGALFSARSWGHTGFTGTSIWADPERDVAVVLLTNRTYDRGNEGQIYDVRRKVHEAVALAITDQPVTPRPGAVLPPELRPKPKPKPSRGARGRRTTHTPTHAARKPARRRH